MLNELLIRVFLALFPGGAMAGDTPTAAPQPVVVVRTEREDTARVAQVKLAETLGSADAIHSVRAGKNTVTFTITRGDAAYAVVATTKRGEVIALDVTPVSAGELGGSLSWLADEMQGITAVTKLVPDEDGAVTIVTNDNRRYQIIPGRGSGGGNEAVSARWAAEWNRT